MKLLIKKRSLGYWLGYAVAVGLLANVANFSVIGTVALLSKEELPLLMNALIVSTVMVFIVPTGFMVTVVAILRCFIWAKRKEREKARWKVIFAAVGAVQLLPNLFMIIAVITAVVLRLLKKKLARGKTKKVVYTVVVVMCATILHTYILTSILP